MRRQSGFTLLELMIVVAIIGILAAIAIPQYNQYTNKSRINEAFNTLSDLRVRMEQYYQDNKQYGNAGSCTTVAANATPVIAMPTTPNVKYFTYSCVSSGSATADSDQAFVLTATSKLGPLGAAGDYVYTIDQSDTRATTKVKGAVSTLQCWVTAPGSTC